MQFKNTKEKYGVITKRLHALIALLFIAQFVIIYWRDFVPKGDLNLQLIMLHKSFGFTLLILGLIFILWRFVNTKPGYPSEVAKWEIKLSHTVQFFLYCCILLMPVTGMIMSIMGGYGVKWFGYALPNLLPIDKSIAKTAKDMHIYISYFVIFLFILHASGALKHHFLHKNNILKRMWL